MDINTISKYRQLAHADSNSYSETCPCKISHTSHFDSSSPSKKYVMFVGTL